MSRRLILVEGLPGSGKSTAAKQVEHTLQALGHNVRAFYEGDAHHPADYDGIAYFTVEQFNELLPQLPTGLKIEDFFEKTKEGYFIKHKLHAHAFPHGVLEKIWAHDVYELPLELHITLQLNKWRRFAKYADFDDTIFVFECTFLQNPVTVGMVRDDCDQAKIAKYIYEINEIIKGFKPILIYLCQDDIRESFEHVIKERPAEWLEGFVNYYTQRGFGWDRGFVGVDGTIEVLKARKAMEVEILMGLDLEKWIVARNQKDNKEIIVEQIHKKFENKINEETP